MVSHHLKLTANTEKQADREKKKSKQSLVQGDSWHEHISNATQHVNMK